MQRRLFVGIFRKDLVKLRDFENVLHFGRQTHNFHFAATLDHQHIDSRQLTDTPQDDLERGLSNWYTFNVSPPFTMHDFSLGHGEITLTILGDDAWLPASLFLFGLDTASGRPTHVVPIVSVPRWGMGALSTDQGEGSKVVRLLA